MKESWQRLQAVKTWGGWLTDCCIMAPFIALESCADRGDLTPLCPAPLTRDSKGRAPPPPVSRLPYAVCCGREFQRIAGPRCSGGERLRRPWHLGRPQRQRLLLACQEPAGWCRLGYAPVLGWACALPHRAAWPVGRRKNLRNTDASPRNYDVALFPTRWAQSVSKSLRIKLRRDTTVVHPRLKPAVTQ